MTALDDEIGPQVVEVLAELGIAATLISTRRAFDPPSVDTGVADKSHAVTVSPPTVAKDFMDGETAERRDTVTYLAGRGAPAVPKPLDFLKLAGTRYSVVAVDEIRSGDAVAAYKVRLRR